MTKEDAAAPCCSFCGKAQLEVWKLFGGPAAHICNECVKLCSDIFSEECPRSHPKGWDPNELTSATRASVLEAMGSLASNWSRLHQIVGGQTGDWNLESAADTGLSEAAGFPSRTDGQLDDPVRQIIEHLSFSVEVLHSMGRCLRQPGFKPSRVFLKVARERLDQRGTSCWRDRRRRPSIDRKHPSRYLPAPT